MEGRLGGYGAGHCISVERAVHFMTVRNYVIQQLEGYHHLCQLITTLQFELQTAERWSEADEIEAMTFAQPQGERVQTSGHADKTAQAAMQYRETLHKARRQMQSQLDKLNVQVRRLDAYLEALPKEQSEVLRQYYFEGSSWQMIADREGVCLRTVIKRRERAMAQLEEFFGRLADLGYLPGVSTQK